jgi:hypothetical protein
MSALPPKADIVHDGGNVRFVPKAEVIEPNGRRRIIATSVSLDGSSMRLLGGAAHQWLFIIPL